MVIDLHKSDNERTPVIGHFEITRRCSYHCGFCYNHIEDKEELCTEKIIELVHSFKEAGCFYLNISGGEPMIRNDFSEIYRRIIEMGIHVTLETNLSLLNEEVLTMINEYPPVKIMISIYGATEATHQRVTKSVIPLKRIQDNIAHLVDQGHTILLRTPVSKYNYQELDKIKAYADELKVEYRFDPKIWWTQSGERRYEFRCRTDMVEPYRKTDNIFEDLYWQLKVLEEKPYRIKNCRWGENEFYVNPYGELHYCIIFWMNKYNLLTGSFEEGWNIWYKKYRENGCIGCHLYPTEGQCPSGYLYYNKELNVSKRFEEYGSFNGAIATERIDTLNIERNLIS